MKNMKIFVFSVMILLTALLCTSCFSPIDPEGEGAFSIKLGSGSGRSAVDTTTELSTMEHIITFRGPGRTVEKVLPPGTLSATVQLVPGRWTITIRAVGDTNKTTYDTTIFTTPRILRAFATQTVEVSARNNSTSITMFPATEVSNWPQLTEAVSKARTDGKVDYIFVAGPITVPAYPSPSSSGATVPANTNILLSSVPGTSWTIMQNSGTRPAPLFTVAAGKLTLGDPARPEDRLILDGNTSYSTGDVSLIGVTGGELIMYDGIALQNNIMPTGGNGGAVRIESGSFTMNGGTISGNSVVMGGGGGVYINSGSFIMNGGTISGNSVVSGGNGGGVYINSGSFIMNGGTISGNTTSGSGGGVGTGSGPITTITMYGGNISGNTAGGGGGGVDSKSFTMYGGNISGNIANYGGGVYNVGTFTMYGGNISGNTAIGTYDTGGGVRNMGIFTMYGGSISGNTSSAGGGGVGNGNTFTMSGGTISGNGHIVIIHGTSYGPTGTGGGVFNSDSLATFTMSGGTITNNNYATGNGNTLMLSTNTTATYGTGGTPDYTTTYGNGTSPYNILDTAGYTAGYTDVALPYVGLAP